MNKVDRNSLLRVEYREVLKCMSSKRGSHHIVGVYHEDKMENSQGRGERKGIIFLGVDVRK